MHANNVCSRLNIFYTWVQNNRWLWVGECVGHCDYVASVAFVFLVSVSRWPLGSFQFSKYLVNDSCVRVFMCRPHEPRDKLLAFAYFVILCCWGARVCVCVCVFAELAECIASALDGHQQMSHEQGEHLFTFVHAKLAIHFMWKYENL